MFTLDLALHNDATQGQSYLDMHAFDVEVSLKTGCMKVVFLNKFVQSLLVCLSHCVLSKITLALLILIYIIIIIVISTCLQRAV